MLQPTKNCPINDILTCHQYKLVCMIICKNNKLGVERQKSIPKLGSNSMSMLSCRTFTRYTILANLRTPRYRYMVTIEATNVRTLDVAFGRLASHLSGLGTDIFGLQGRFLSGSRTDIHMYNPGSYGQEVRIARSASKCVSIRMTTLLLEFYARMPVWVE